MASLTLQNENAVVKEYAVGETATIGRLTDNLIAIDSPGVSSHHAYIFRSANDFVIEDLQSTNGTFVNGKRIARCKLTHGDVVVVGKHTLVFNQLADAATAPSQEAVASAHQGETVFLDPQKHQRLLTLIQHGEDLAAAGEEEAFGPVGVLRVLSGTTDCPEYELKGHTSLIGKGASTLIRLRGWFKPSVAVAVTRNRHGYVATRLRGKMLVNSEPVSGRCDLKSGDVLSVGGLTLEFRLKDAEERHAGAA
jgi:pSer/pThr/pTyr-binding forkhead associated (FHA) protein